MGNSYTGGPGTRITSCTPVGSWVTICAVARVRLIVHKTWLVQNPPSDLDAAIDRVIQSHGMTATRVGDRLELVGGSSFKVKALGARLTADFDLPRVGTVERSAPDAGSATDRITVHLEDRLNSAFIDPPIRRKYDRVLQGFAAAVEAALGAPSPEPPADGEIAEEPLAPAANPIVRPAGWWTDVSLGTIVKGCHVAGARRQDIGALVATEAGIAFTGQPQGGCRWEDLADIEVIELRQGGAGGRLLRHCVKLTSRDGEVGEFWTRGRAEPRAVHEIRRLVQGSR